MARMKNLARNLAKDRRFAFGYAVRQFGRDINRAALETFLMHDASPAFIASFHRAIRTPHQTDANVLNLLVTAMGQRTPSARQSLGKAA
jgi:hypothetical protein